MQTLESSDKSELPTPPIQLDQFIQDSMEVDLYNKFIHWKLFSLLFWWIHNLFLKVPGLLEMTNNMKYTYFFVLLLFRTLLPQNCLLRTAKKMYLPHLLESANSSTDTYKIDKIAGVGGSGGQRGRERERLAKAK